MVSTPAESPDSFLAEILGQPSALQRAAEGLAGQLDALAALARRHAQRPVLFTGMGTSYYACHAPVTLLAGAGRDASMVETAELLASARK